MVDSKIKDLTTKSPVVATDQFVINDVVGGNIDKKVESSAIKTYVKDGMTSSDVGLGNVDNTSDANKPVSSATQTALNLKSNLASPTFTGTVVLPNIPTIVQTALDLKQNIVSGVDDTEIGYLNGVTSAIQTQLNAKQAVVSGVDDTEIGYLNGVTSAIQTQLNGKASSSHTHPLSEISDITATATEVNYTTDVTSNIQAQINAKATLSNGGYLMAHWDQSSTKTNIGTSFVDVYTQTNSIGKAIKIDTTGFTTIRLMVTWNKVGSGTQSIQVIAVDDASVIVSKDIVSGENDTGFVAIPAGSLNEEHSYKLQVKSTTSGDDPVFEGASIWLK